MMQTIDRLLRDATWRLEAESDNPRLDAEVLLAHVTGHARAYFRAWPEMTLPADRVSVFERLLIRRLAGHPVAHLVGTREFWSREFRVNPDVLIPRPETELLVEWVLSLPAPHQPLHIADLGTGSGALAITLALELPDSRVTAIDVSPAALTVAQENARRLGARNVRFLHGDWFAALPGASRFDLIVSNPPYIAETDPHLRQGDVRFEPALALTSGIDGLDAVRRIVAEAPAFLSPDGRLLCEHGFDQAEAVRRLLCAAGYAEVESRKDLLGHERASGGVHRAKASARR
jgi:release factor glutamine methyltransferase